MEKENKLAARQEKTDNEIVELKDEDLTTINCGCGSNTINIYGYGSKAQGCDDMPNISSYKQIVNMDID